MTQDELKKVLSYDPCTGIFTRKGRPTGRVNKGYVQISIKSRLYSAHRLAWLYMTGEWPALEIDHRDGNALNNSWSNLRLATRGQNCQNCKVRKDNSTGAKGVYPAGGGRFMAQVRANGARYSRAFAGLEEAAEWADFVRQELHGEFCYAV